MPNQVLERFHRALIEEIQTQRPEYLTSRFTVSEIYQNLVPYGSHRDRIGVDMNGDYEDALIRLLAGEGGFLVLESEPALRDLMAELESPNPNTGLYREFAAVDVRLNQAHLDLSAAAVDQLPGPSERRDVEDPGTVADLAPSERTGSAADMGIVPPGVDIFADRPSAVDTSTDRPRGVDIFADEAPVEPEAVEAPVEAPGPVSGTRRPPLAPEFVGGPAPNGSPGDGPVETTRNEAMHRAPASDESTCRGCRATLPDRENVNFCPFCGTDLALVTCSGCGEEVEAGWLYCASCGTGVGA